jgi:hypothetical protein
MDPDPPNNGASIHVPCHIMRKVLSSAAEAKLAGVFHNGKEACPLRACLTELGHPQPPTPIQTDNSTAAGIANNSVKQKRSKAMDMRFYWIRDRVRRGQLLVYWRKGARTVPTILPNIIQHRIIKPFGPRNYIRQLIGPKTTSNASKIWIMLKSPTTL